MAADSADPLAMAMRMPVDGTIDPADFEQMLELFPTHPAIRCAPVRPVAA